MTGLKNATTNGYIVMFLTQDANSYIAIVTDGISKQTGTWSIDTLEPWANNAHLELLVMR